jgi:hypothetical protein
VSVHTAALPADAPKTFRCNDEAIGSITLLVNRFFDKQ